MTPWPQALIVLALLLGWAAPTEADSIPISWIDALEHVGEDVTIEGLIVATHASPLSTLLSFDSGFNRFTAVIPPAVLGSFPTDPHEHYRDKWVRIRGEVIEYDKKAEIVLRNPAQIRILESTVPPRESVATKSDADDVEKAERDEHLEELTLELLRRLTAIEDSLANVADRLDLLVEVLQQPEQPESPAVYFMPGYIPSPDRPDRPRSQTLRSIKQGMTAATVEQLLGPPAMVNPDSEGGEVWYYGSNRSVTFNSRGRVKAMIGMRRR